MQGFAVQSIPANPPSKGSSKNSAAGAARGEAFINSQRHEGWVCLPRLMTMPASPTRRWIAPLCNHFARLVRLSYLTLDITQAILDGRQPADLTADKLLAHSRLPLAWHDQRNVLGFA